MSENKYDGWVDFIVRNFKSGTATEVSKHIEKQAKIQGYNTTNKAVRATVRKILPESVLKTGDRPSNKGRKIVRELFGYSKATKRYWLLSDYVKDTLASQDKLTLDNKKNVKIREDNGEQISIKTPKDKSIKHSELLALITEYARQKGYEAEPEKDNIDLLFKDKDGKYTINEVKTYKNSIYVAVGQVQFYKYNISNKYELDYNDVTLNIVGNFKLDEKYKKWLRSLEINYIHEDEFQAKIK